MLKLIISIKFIKFVNMILVNKNGKKINKPKEWVDRQIASGHLAKHGWRVQKEPADIVSLPDSTGPFINPDWNTKDTKAAINDLTPQGLIDQLQLEKDHKNRKSIISLLESKIDGN